MARRIQSPGARRALTLEELATISRTYNEHLAAIEEAILVRLRNRVPQVEIAREFGVAPQQISRRAKRAGINYYEKELTKTQAFKKCGQKCQKCDVPWSIGRVSLIDGLIVCLMCQEKEES